MAENNRQKRKMNNNGMTLVEILVAMAILTIVTLGLLQAFVSAVNYNKDAKEKQRAINLAQTVMESFKAYSLEDVSRQFNNVDVFNIYKGSIGGYSEPTPSMDIYGNFTPSVTNEYLFSMQDVVYDGKTYNVDITMKPNAAATSTEEIVKVPRFSAYNDAIFTQPSDEYKYVYQDAIKQLKDAGMIDGLLPTLDNIKKDKIIINSRKTTITMFNDSGAERVSASVVYQYTFDKYEIEKDDGTTEELETSHTVTINSSNDSTTYDVYNNSITRTAGAKLDNLYIYFYPAYNNELAGSKCEKDYIYIVNNTGVERNVYLVKQIRPGFSDANTLTSESTYDPIIDLSGKGINLYHNLGKKLVGEGGASYLIYNRPSEDTLHTEWFDKETKILVYDVQITVTDKAKGTADIVLDGSVNDRQ